MNLKQIINEELNEYIDKKIAPLKQDAIKNWYKPLSPFKYIRDVKNEWLIHFTRQGWDVPNEIFNKGFLKAHTNTHTLAMTCNDAFDDYRDDDGYSFAFTLEDDLTKTPFYNYLVLNSENGVGAVLFKACGIKVRNLFNDEDEVIFHNTNAKDIIPIFKIDENWYIKSCISKKALVKSENIKDVIEWVTQNFDQYRKHLVNPKEHSIKNNKNNTDFDLLTKKERNRNKYNFDYIVSRFYDLNYEEKEKVFEILFYNYSNNFDDNIDVDYYIDEYKLYSLDDYVYLNKYQKESFMEDFFEEFEKLSYEKYGFLPFLNTFKRCGIVL